MTAEQFANLINGKRVKKGKWVALCPVHQDRTASLAISEGKKRPVVVKCMSRGCELESILKAIGLTWADFLGDRAITPEIRRQLRDNAHLSVLETRWGALMFLKVADYDNRHYWGAAEHNAWDRMETQRDKMDAERARRKKMQAAIRRFGWDRIWGKFLATEKGKAIAERWGI